MAGSSTAPGEANATGQPVTVLFFASAREAAGARSAPLAAAGSTVAQLAGVLVATYGPGLGRVLGTCAIWVNGEPVPEGYVLRAGDEVAVVPPVSGGAGGDPLDRAVSGRASAVTSEVMDEFNLVVALDPDYLLELGNLSLADLRAKRDACGQLETDLSYLRRLAQARVDLIMAESERRLLGLSDQGPEALVDQLPQILGEHSRGEGPGRMPISFFAPADSELQKLAARVEEMLPSDQLGSLGELSSVELDDLLVGLSNLEHDVSAERRALHDIQDHLQEELVRRYRSGEANVDSLLK